MTTLLSIFNATLIHQDEITRCEEEAQECIAAAESYIDWLPLGQIKPMDIKALKLACALQLLAAPLPQMYSAMTRSDMGCLILEVLLSDRFGAKLPFLPKSGLAAYLRICYQSTPNPYKIMHSFAIKMFPPDGKRPKDDITTTFTNSWELIKNV